MQSNRQYKKSGVIRLRKIPNCLCSISILWNKNRLIERHKIYESRLSDWNKKNGHAVYSIEDKRIRDFEKMLEAAEAVFPENNKNRIKFSISLVCHNNLELTKKCIASILKYSNSYELLLWNNASTDGTKEYFDDIQSERVKVYHSDINEGFGKPHNQNFDNSNGEYFVVINNDIEVCPNWLTLLAMPFGFSKDIGIVGIEGNCTSLNENGLGYPGEILEYIEASCMMIPRQVINHIGLFDYNLFQFAYCEDVDLSLRCREAGYKIKNFTIDDKT